MVKGVEERVWGRGRERVYVVPKFGGEMVVVAVIVMAEGVKEGDGEEGKASVKRVVVREVMNLAIARGRERACDGGEANLGVS